MNAPWIFGAGPARTTTGFSTPDLSLLNANYRRSRLAHDAMVRGQQHVTDDDLALLSSATPDELDNLYGPPRTEREARLQKVISNDVIAKEKGATMIPTWQAILAKAKAEQDLANSRATVPLHVRTLDQQQARDYQTMLNNAAQRKQAAQNAAYQERYRQSQILNAQANRDQRGQQFNQTQAQRDFQNMLAMERHLQEVADEQARQGHNVYQDVARAAERGAIPERDIQQNFGDLLDPSMLALAQGYARSYGQQQGQSVREENALRQMLAENYNEQLRQDREREAKKWWGATPDAELAAPIVQSMLKNRQALGRVNFDRSSNEFSPVLQADPYGEDEPLSDDLGMDMAPPPMPAPPVPIPSAPQALPPPRQGEIRRDRNGRVAQFNNGRWVLRN